nr:hypothetical protein [Tanacetum cinerariifolium]
MVFPELEEREGQWLNPFGCAKLTTFVIMCKAYGCEPSVDPFNLFPGGKWLAFAKRPKKHIPNLLPKIMTRIKVWKAGRKPSWEYGQQRPTIIVDGNEMAFRDFLAPCHSNGAYKETGGEHSRFGGLSSPRKLVIHSKSVAASINGQKCRTRGLLSLLLRVDWSKLVPTQGILARTLLLRLILFFLPFMMMMKMKGEYEVLKEREKVRDKECKELKVKCEAVMADFDNNPAVKVLHEKIADLFIDVSLSTLESKVASLEAEKAKLEATEASLPQEVENVKLDRAEIISKVVPYVAIKLVQSDDMASLGERPGEAFYYSGFIESEDFIEDLFPNQPSGNPTFLPHPELTSPKVNNDIFDSERCNVLSEKLLDLDSTKDLHPPIHDNPLSGSTTYPLLEEFANELPPKYDDNLQFDIESDLKEIEFMLYQDKDYSLKDSIYQKNRANLSDNFVDSIPEMFTDEHAPDYSSPPIFDVYDDDFLEVESDAEKIYNDPFDSKEVDALPSTNNEDKIFNPSILIQEKPVEIITHVVQDKKLAISNASLVFEDFDPPFYEPLFFKEVPKSKMLLIFSSENEEKVFKPGIHTSKKVHSIPRNLKTLAKGFCTQVFIFSASIGNHVSKSDRINVYLMAYFINDLRLT